MTMQNTLAQDFKRYSNQNEEILDLLKRGPVSNRQLTNIAFSYTRRISDLRQQGYKIECNRVTGGLTEYRLTR